MCPFQCEASFLSFPDCITAAELALRSIGGWPTLLVAVLCGLAALLPTLISSKTGSRSEEWVVGGTGGGYARNVLFLAVAGLSPDSGPHDAQNAMEQLHAWGSPPEGEVAAYWGLLPYEELAVPSTRVQWGRRCGLLWRRLRTAMTSPQPTPGTAGSAAEGLAGQSASSSASSSSSSTGGSVSDRSFMSDVLMSPRGAAATAQTEPGRDGMPAAAAAAARTGGGRGRVVAAGRGAGASLPHVRPDALRRSNSFDDDDDEVFATTAAADDEEGGGSRGQRAAKLGGSMFSLVGIRRMLSSSSSSLNGALAASAGASASAGGNSGSGGGGSPIRVQGRGLPPMLIPPSPSGMLPVPASVGAGSSASGSASASASRLAARTRASGVGGGARTGDAVGLGTILTDHLGVHELPRHLYRLYFGGTNTAARPLALRVVGTQQGGGRGGEGVPPELLNVVSPVEFGEHAMECNGESGSCGRLVCVCVYVLPSPVSIKQRLYCMIILTFYLVASH